MSELVVNHLKMIGDIKNEVSNLGGKTGLIMLSGSHMYGFPSADSDYDYRGFYTLQTGKIVGLDGIRDHISFTRDDNDVDIMEIRKFINLLLKMNCNTLEHLFAQPLFDTTTSIELKELISQCISKKGLYDSYKGMAVTNYKKFIFTGKKKTVKKYLYVFRALFAGIHALKTGTIEPNIIKLNDIFDTQIVDKLIEDKLDGLENDIAKDKYGEGEIDGLVNAWIHEIDLRYADSKLQPVPTKEQYNAINKWLKELRRNNWDMLK
jgi:Predicted nucleotidyltransferase